MKSWRASLWPKATSLLPTVLAALAGAVVLVSPATTENAVANGDTRTVHLHHAHTHEAIDATFMVDGRYDPVVLEKLNWFLRDWRRDEPTHIDPKLFDTIWEVYRESGSQQPIEVMSAYRSPETNSMLRHASRGVAEHSQHILGKAMDQHYVDVPMSKIRELAMRLQRGGVGFYPTAGTPFVHMDVGGVRHWPRMSYDQLARLFPDGKTVHIPANGQPLPGYETARAELEARGDSFDYPTAGEVKSKGFFAWLFGGGDDEGDGEATREAAPVPRRSGRSQVAVVDPAPIGSTGVDNIRNGDDAGVHSFSVSPARPADPAPLVPTEGARRGPRGRAQVAALPVDQPTSADAQQTLAAEMRRQEQVKAAQAQAAQAQAEAQRAAAQAQADARASAAESAPAPSQPGDITPPAPPRASAGRGRSLPPHRPVEAASAGPTTPRPPTRPDAAIGGGGDHAATPGGTRSVAALALPSTRAGLPAAITRGIGSGPVPAHVLAFAPPAAAAVPSGVPLPVTRPQLVAARLDRSNFRSLTGTTPTDRLPSRAGLGSAVTALRPAARASAAALSGEGGSASRRGFGTRATDLPTDRFSGTAATPAEKVDTATLRKRAAPAAAD